MSDTTADYPRGVWSPAEEARLSTQIEEYRASVYRTGDAASLDDVRETGAVRVSIPPAEVSRYAWAYVDPVADLRSAARAHLDAIDAHGPRSREAREAAERLRGML